MVFYSYETKVILLQVPTFQTAQTLHSYVLKSCSCESYLYCREEKNSLVFGIHSRNGPLSFTNNPAIIPFGACTPTWCWRECSSPVAPLGRTTLDQHGDGCLTSWARTAQHFTGRASFLLPLIPRLLASEHIRWSTAGSGSTFLPFCSLRWCVKGGRVGIYIEN
jgi:hypothetical protein